jgi:hypothetical protein
MDNPFRAVRGLENEVRKTTPRHVDTLEKAVTEISPLI